MSKNKVSIRTEAEIAMALAGLPSIPLDPK